MKLFNKILYIVEGVIDNFLPLCFANLLPDLLLDLVAVLLLLLLALFLGLVTAHSLLDLVAGRAQFLLLLVVAHLKTSKVTRGSFFLFSKQEIFPLKNAYITKAILD